MENANSPGNVEYVLRLLNDFRRVGAMYASGLVLMRICVLATILVSGYLGAHHLQSNRPPTLCAQIRSPTSIMTASDAGPAVKFPTRRSCAPHFLKPGSSVILIYTTEFYGVFGGGLSHFWLPGHLRPTRNGAVSYTHLRAHET